MSTSSERRHYTRVPFCTTCKLNQGQHSVVVDLIDISLNGALTSKPSSVSAIEDGTAQLHIELDNNALITMDVELAHQEEHTLGFHCFNLDMESASHLRRLIELNIGVENASDRVLEELLQGHQA